jgi:hypothetical protein
MASTLSHRRVVLLAVLTSALLGSALFSSFPVRAILEQRRETARR